MYRLVLVAAVVFLSSFYGFTSVTDQVTQAAAAGLPHFIAQIPTGQETKYGFAAGDNLQACTVGKPFQMLSLTAEFYNGSYVAGNNYITMGKTWRVPVIANGAYRMLLTVAGDQGNYNAVEIGAAGLAAELQQKSAAAGSNDNLYVLRVHPLSADFLVDAKSASLADATFIPLASATMAMPTLKEGASYSINDVLTTVKAALNHSKN